MHLPIQAKVTPINVPVYELPEYICVETRRISKQFAMEHNIQITQKPAKNVPNLENTRPAAGNGNPKSKLIDCSTMTVMTMDMGQHCNLPCRERSVQTNRRVTSDVAVQCNLQDDWEKWAEAKQSSDVDNTKEESKFLTFVSENTSMYPNGMLECLKCGEVAMALQEHQNHMDIHFGPPGLCPACGQTIDHQRLQRCHNLVCPERPRCRSVMKFKCPHLQCHVVAATEAQLQDHMFKHRWVPAYRCSKCRVQFKTSLAFLMHRLSRMGCRKAKPLCLYRNHDEPLLRKTHSKRCTVCLKRFSSDHVVAKHRRHCIQVHHKRLERLVKKRNRKRDQGNSN